MSQDLSAKAAEAMSNLGNETNQKVELKILREITPFGELTMFDGVNGFMGGHPFMVGKRVAELLDIKNTRDALGRLAETTTLGEYFDKYSVGRFNRPTDEAHKTMVSQLQKQFTNSWRSIKLIQIGGLFELIGRSRKPKAIEFGNFVNYEILPKIARTGSYSINDEKDKEIERLRKANNALKANQAQRIPMEKFDEIEQGNFFFHPRASTLVKKSSLEQMFVKIEQPMRDELNTLQDWGEKEIERIRGEITATWKTRKISLNNSINSAKSLITQLNRHQAAAIIWEKRPTMIEDLNAEIELLGKIKIDTHAQLKAMFEDQKNHILRVVENETYQIEDKHAPIIQVRKEAAQIRLKKEQEKLREFRDGTITIDEWVEWYKDGFDVFAITHKPKELEI